MHKTFLTQEEFDVLPEYSVSLPPLSPGLRWKRAIPGESQVWPPEYWMLGTVVETHNGVLGVRWEQIEICQQPLTEVRGLKETGSQPGNGDASVD